MYGMTINLSNQAKGTLFCFFGVLILTPDSLCVRELARLPDFTVILYKYLFLASFLTIVWFAAFPQTFVKSFQDLGYIGWIASLLWGLCNFLITVGFQTTAVANVLVIIAANPLFSSVLTYYVLKENVPLRTILAACVCFAAILIIFYSQLNASGSDLIGLICALGASISIASYFVLLRLAQVRTG